VLIWAESISDVIVISSLDGSVVLIILINGSSE